MQEPRAKSHLENTTANGSCVSRTPSMELINKTSNDGRRNENIHTTEAHVSDDELRQAEKIRIDDFRYTYDEEKLRIFHFRYY